MKTVAIAFYNTENFFDTIDNPKTFDGDFTPEGTKKWTQKRYENKVFKISNVISKLGEEETGNPPLFVGLAEVENKTILNDLINSKALKDYNYGYVHYLSLDERGIDNAILYRKDMISDVVSKPLTHIYVKKNGSQDFTRDVLYVKFMFKEFEIHTFTIHLPNRQGNSDPNREFRNMILQSLRFRIDEIKAANPNAYVILMGDFNGNPDNNDARLILNTTNKKSFETHEMFNPMIDLMNNFGSSKYRKKWILFDQILFSEEFVRTKSDGLAFKSAKVYDDKSIQDWSFMKKGAPFRTYAGNKYLGGYSDHFPVYAILNY